jgi:hypothetical protein
MVFSRPTEGRDVDHDENAKRIISQGSGHWGVDLNTQTTNTIFLSSGHSFWHVEYRSCLEQGQGDAGRHVSGCSMPTT